MRRALNEFLLEEVSVNSKIVFLTGDLGFGIFDEFQNKFPGNYINAGIAESNMVAVACGLASEGFNPIVYSIASFMTARPYEFIKVLSSYNNLPITIIGAGGGLTYATSGGSHHSLDDLSLMLGIPNMDVYTPAGPHELRYLLSESIRKNKRSYFRIGKFGEKDLVKSQVESTDSPVELIRGSKVALLSHSNMSEQVLSVAEEYRKQKFGQVGFYHFPSIRPWNEKRVVKILQSYDFVTVVEEHWPTGALYSEILRVSNEYSCKAQISRLGPKLNYLHEVCDIQEARKMFGYDVDSIIRYIASL